MKFKQVTIFFSVILMMLTLLVTSIGYAFPLNFSNYVLPQKSAYMGFLNKWRIYKNSLLKAVTGAGETYNFTYFDNNRLKSEGKAGEIISYTYQDNGNLDTMTYPDTTVVNYDSNNMNMVSKISADWITGDFDYTFDTLGRVNTLTYPNSIVESRGYNNNSQIASITSKLGLADINQFIYAYNSRNLRDSVTTLRGLEDYDYDELNRLKQVIYPATPSVTVDYTFDNAGNRTQTVTDSIPTIYTPNNLNQYSAVDGVTFNYDLNGNLTFDGINTYIYDAENRLVKVTTADKIINLSYDLLGRREVKEVTDLVLTPISYERYIYSGSQIVMDKNSVGTVTAKYLYGAGIDDVLNVDKSGVNYFYHKDGLNSVTEITDSTGAIVERYTYEVYGERSIFDASNILLAESSIGNTIGFTGRIHDKDTGLINYRNRDSHPQLGRFLQTDPIGYYDSTNLYEYVNSNPTNFIDPFGLCAAGAGTGGKGGIGNAINSLLGLGRRSGGGSGGGLMDQIKQIGSFLGKFFNKRGNRAFWSGGRDIAGKAAMKWAKENKAKSLEMTLAGRLLEKFGKYLPLKLESKLWDMLSKSFAKGAKGDVNIFQNTKGVSLNSTWRRVEYPILKDKGNTIKYHNVS